jgi:SAM-dependent methyltransferase
LGAIVLILLLSNTVANPAKQWLFGIGIAGFVPILISTLVSWYVYDLSGFYHLKWIHIPVDNKPGTILNIHAGFDETSTLIREKFPDTKMSVYDFYDPEKHTEISIERARRAYPAYAGTRQINTNYIPEADESIDFIFLIFAAHEIRNDEERIRFFKELNRVLKKDGTLQVVEHLRNLPNFLAYTIGSLHFLSSVSWHETFAASGFAIKETTSINPFVKYYILQK